MKKCKKKANTPEWLGVLVGGRAKLSTGWMGGWVGGQDEGNWAGQRFQGGKMG